MHHPLNMTYNKTQQYRMDDGGRQLELNWFISYTGAQKARKLEKGFQEKPIVAFTNSTVFILDFNIWLSHVLALSALSNHT